MSQTQISGSAAAAMPAIVAGTNDDARQALSCCMDNELDHLLSHACLEQACRDPRARADWALWHAAGDALRSGDVARWHSGQFTERFARTLAVEATLLAPHRFHRDHFVRRVLLPGSAIAAAAAMLVIVALPQLRGGAEQVASAMDTKAQREPASNVVTVVPAAASTPDVAPEELMSPQLERYLAAHREMTSGSVMTRSVLYLRAAPASSESSR